ncbi:MAG: preprotein translocase subunit YajC [Spongiibacteraceae bacterium]
MSFFITEALAQPATASAPGTGSAIFQILFLGGLFVLFYFLAIRPQRKRQKEHADMVTNLAKGDEVVTTGGLLGRVVKVEDDYVALKVADNVELKFQKHAVHAVLPKGTLKSV